MRNWKTITALLAAVALAYIAFAPVAGSQPTGWLSFLTQDPQGAVQFRALSQYGMPVMAGHGTALPTAANSGVPPMDGELFMVHAAATDPVLWQYSGTDTAWYTVPNGDTQTIAGAWTFTSATIFNGNVTIGNNEDDTLMIDGPTYNRVRTENFAQVGCGSEWEEDWSAAVVTDASENMLVIPCSPLGVIAYRIEAPGGPGLADTPAPFAVDGRFSTDGYVDAANNEGIVFVFGSFGPDLLGAYADEDAAVDMYAEIDLTITTIANIDDLWFGWIVQEAYDNPPASADYDTSALFVISDNAGDLDIETELNGGGTLNDDAVEVWADGENHVLKVELGADAVAFILDGTTVAQTNAVLNMDNGDRAVVVLGYTLSAAAADPVIHLDYVEIGQEQ